MKYLKPFNESKTPLLITKQDMKDVFQDIIDDYDFYDLDQKSPLPCNGFHYEINKYSMGAGGIGGKCSIYFFFIENGIYAFSPVIKSIDFTPHINKLEKMGYVVSHNINEYNNEDQYNRHGSGNIKIVVSNPPEEYIPGNRTHRQHGLHSTRQIQESITDDDFKYHKETIKDVLQDIIDKYDIYEFSDRGNYGYIYSITYNTFLADPNKMYTIGSRQTTDLRAPATGGIRLEISCTNGITPKSIIDYRSQDFIDFENRLKSMGYSVTSHIRLDTHVEWIVFYIFP